MKIQCSKCNNKKKFTMPMWVRATFRFNEDGTIAILHTTPLESIEEKLVGQRQNPMLKCAVCGAAAEIEFNEYEQKDTEASQLKALEVI